ncbi:MAG: MBL fold metallo-hydrolase [Chloroflexi bacterium]|nr:MBL fold metallo-hydrolase [Chloroflexota bacterium]
MQRLLDNLYCFEDTCNVYVLRNGAEAVLIDFGSGDVLDRLAQIGVERVVAVLMTHHHRDQGQGLPLAVAAGIPIWVPHTEQDLFCRVDAHWQAREIACNYNMRQDRFSLLEPVPIAGTLKDYDQQTFAGMRFTVLPTPGHTTGSITLWTDMGGQRIAFSGDLIAAPGKVWSLSATQWTYNGAEGVAAGLASLLDLRDRAPDLLLPSHGAPMTEPIAAIDLLADRLWELLQLRGNNLRLYELRERPYEIITPHLLMHRASMANTFVLISQSRKALMIDFGYDFITGIPLGTDRASRRPWLYTLPALKRQYGVDRVDVVLPTHFHDDHVAGINLLRTVEGTQHWAPELFADILEQPLQYDLPCIWYDPIPVDRRLPLETPFTWEEYSFTLHPLPGHTRYAVAIAFEVDGYRVLAAGDQYQRDDGLELNYVYPNRFDASDYVLSAELYRRLNPNLILTGHWRPFWVPSNYFGKLATLGDAVERLHRELLPDSPDLGTEGFLARISPYQTEAHGEPIEFQVEVHNPYDRPVQATVALVAPPGWLGMGGTAIIPLEARGMGQVSLAVRPPDDFTGRRARVAVDLTIDGHRFGQQAEALVSARA